MIFTPDHIQKIVNGTKTETRRIVKEGEGGCTDGPHQPFYVYTESRRIKWEVGKGYAVQSKRGRRGLWYNPSTLEFSEVEDNKQKIHLFSIKYLPLRIKILHIQREPLQAITRDDAWLEGITGVSSRPITDYRKLWDSINQRPGTRWADNPQVWVIKFEVLKTCEQ